MSGWLSEGVDIITSASNPLIKHVKGLQLKKNREVSQQFIAEGMKLVKEALASEAATDMLIFSEASPELLQGLLPQVQEKGIRCIQIPETLFKSISDAHSPEGVMAVVQTVPYSLEPLLNRPSSFLIVLDGVTDPGNLGTMIRTMDAAGGDGVVLLEGCVDPYNPKVVRATMGSIFRVPLIQGCKRTELPGLLVKNQYHIVTSHLRGSNVFCWPGGFPKTALVIGSESHGVSDEMVDAADCLVKIPMIGKAESLNASVAAGILIYEIFRKGMKMDE